MEYQQITLNEWQEMKKEIESDLLNVKLAFVRIGYNLRRIEEQELYRQDGYKSIAEFAREEYGLGASTVSRFIAINRRFSIDGNSRFLDHRYSTYSSSALQEMLTLPDHDLEMITPETKRETIRELKKFNADAADIEESSIEEARQPEDQEAQLEDQEENGTGTEKADLTTENAQLTTEKSPVEKLIITFFEENPEILDRLYRTEGFPEGDTAVLRDMVNPSGSRSVRNGAWILIMNETDLKYKRFGGKVETLTWEEFLQETDRIYAAQAEAAGRKNILGWKKAEEKANEKTGDKGLDQKETEKNAQPVGDKAGGSVKIQTERQETDGGDPGEPDDRGPEENRAGERAAEHGDRPGADTGVAADHGKRETEPEAEDRKTGEPDQTPGDGDNGDGGDSGDTAPEGRENTVAPAQETGAEGSGPEEMQEEKPADKGEKAEMKRRMINTANLVISDLQHEEWAAAEHHLKFIMIWLEEIQGKN